MKLPHTYLDTANNIASNSRFSSSHPRDVLALGTVERGAGLFCSIHCLTPNCSRMSLPLKTSNFSSNFRAGVGKELGGQRGRQHCVDMEKPSNAPADYRKPTVGH